MRSTNAQMKLQKTLQHIRTKNLLKMFVMMWDPPLEIRNMNSGALTNCFTKVPFPKLRKMESRLYNMIITEWSFSSLKRLGGFKHEFQFKHFFSIPTEYLKVRCWWHVQAVCEQTFMKYHTQESEPYPLHNAYKKEKKSFLKAIRRVHFCKIPSKANIM